MKTQLLFAIGLMALTPALSRAEDSSLKDSGRQENKRDILKEKALSLFEENAPEGNKDMTPQFGIFGKEDKFYLGIGGSVMATMGLDMGDPLDNPNEFITAHLKPAAPGDGTKFHLSAMQSNLHVNFVAFPDSKNKVGAFIGINFLNDYCPVLQYAYIKYRGIKAGYDYSAFSDNGALPPTIDYEGPNSATPLPTPMLAYSYSFGKNKAWTATAALELPDVSSINSPLTRSVNQAVPNIPVSLRYSWGGGGSWVKVSAILRNMAYRSELQNKNVDKVGWGISLSGTAEILPGLTCFWTGTYGHGIANLYQDTDGCCLDLTPSADGRSLKTSPSWGAFGGLQYNFTDNVYCSASYSHVRNYAKAWSLGDETFGNQYRYAQYAVGNIFWDITPIVSTGLEYIYGRRVNNDGVQAHASRLQMMLKVRF